jgi:hypothetical protein
MGQVLHGCSRTTAAVRRALQHSQKSLHELAEQYEINPKTVAKWKKRSFPNNAPMGPKEVRSTVLTEEKAAIVALSCNSGCGLSCRALGSGRRGRQPGIKSGIGASPSGKAADFDSAMRRFESSRPSRQSGLRGVISRCVRIRDIPAGYAGAPQSLAGNLRHFGPCGESFGRRSLLAIF